MKQFFTLTLMLCSALAWAQPSNDLPCNAQVVAVDGGPVLTNNIGATADSDEVLPPNNQGGYSCVSGWCNDDLIVQNSVWFSFVCPENGAVSITTCLEGSAVDTQIALWLAADCSDYSTFNFVAANDDMENGCTLGDEYASTIDIDGLTPGETFLVQVDGWDASEDTFFIAIETGVPTALLNIIHASADPAAEIVDVRINGEMLLDDFAFMSCSGLLSIPAGTDQTITLHASNSTDASTPLLSTTLNADPSLNYEIVVMGHLATTGFNPPQPLTFVVAPGMQLFSTVQGSVPIHFIHASTDAPVVDFVQLESNTTMADNLAYGNFNSEGYIQVSENFTLSVEDENGNQLGLEYCLPAAFSVDFGVAFSVIAMGFLDPASNSGGIPLSIFIADWTTGDMYPLDMGACLFPDNDNICSPGTLIVNDPPTSANNTFATVDDNETSPFNLPSNDPESDCVTAWCDGTLDNTVWFEFAAPASGSVLITTCFLDGIDTQIALCTVGDCADPSTVEYAAANDDMEAACDGNQYSSELTASGLTPGQMYHIQVDGYDGEIGNFQIQVLSIETPVAETESHSLSVYPNPASDFIMLSNPVSQSIRIVNALGMEVMQLPRGTQRFEVEALQTGVYFISSAEENQHFNPIRFVKQ